MLRVMKGSMRVLTLATCMHRPPVKGAQSHPGAEHNSPPVVTSLTCCVEAGHTLGVRAHAGQQDRHQSVGVKKRHCVPRGTEDIAHEMLTHPSPHHGALVQELCQPDSRDPLGSALMRLVTRREVGAQRRPSLAPGKRNVWAPCQTHLQPTT